MKSLELVVHCFAGKLSLYADHLRFQLASLIDNPPKAVVSYSLFWAGPQYDRATSNVIEEFDSLLRPNVLFRTFIQPRELLFRRAIARHFRSQWNQSDVLWYCDADMYFGYGSIDSVCAQVGDDGKLYFPRRTMMSIDHETGDKAVASQGDWPKINPAEYRSQKNHFAIGGIQILGQNTALRTGYFGFKQGEPGYNRRHTKWVQPVDPEKPFAEFRDDCAWRRHHFSMTGGEDRQVKIDVPNLFRLRHTLSSLRPDGFKDDATVSPARRR